MDPIDITGTKLTVFLNLRFKDKAAAADYNIVNDPMVQNNQSLNSIFPSALNVYLNQPVSDLFDQIWNSDTDPNGQTLLQQFTTKIQKRVVSSAAAAGYEALDVSAALPPTGVLSAVAFSATATRTGDLVLIYLLSGCQVSYRTKISGPFANPSWQLDFDAQLIVNSTVPMLPCILSPNTSIEVENANIQAENYTATLGEFFGGLINAIQDEPYNIFQAAEGAIDTTTPTAPYSQIGILVQALAQAGVPLQSLGFLQFQADVESNPPTLTFRMVHPVDPGPVLYNATVGNPEIPVLSNPPALGLSRLAVEPGTAVTVTGTNFPISQMNQLSIEWTDTTSGPLTESQIQYCPGTFPSPPPTADIPPPPPGTTIVTKNRARTPGDSRNTFTATGLNNNSPYSFRVRDADALTHTDWSAPLLIKTAATDAITLYLSGSTIPIGTSYLTTGAPFWSTLAAIPANTVPGVHRITAQVDGNALASVDITVLAAGLAAPVILEVLDPLTNAVASDPYTVPGASLTLHGEGYPPGAVTITFSGFASTYNATANAGGDFTTVLSCPPTGGFSITVSGSGTGGAQASVDLQVIQPPH